MTRMTPPTEVELTFANNSVMHLQVKNGDGISMDLYDGEPNFYTLILVPHVAKSQKDKI